MGEKRTYNIVDFIAINLLLDDVKLHAACDFADSGFWCKQNYAKTIRKSLHLGCHKLWDNLSKDQKEIYRKLAHNHLFGTTEITQAYPAV